MKKIIFGVAGFLSFWGFAFFAQAQENAAGEDNNMENSNVVLVADVNIYNAEIKSQSENVLEIFFDLSNGSGSQSDIKYSVELIREDDGGNQVVADEKVYPEIIDLKDSQNVEKNIKYEAPEYLNGNYYVWVFAKNKNGLEIALANLGEISLSGKSQYLNISNSSCYLKIDSRDESYSLIQGVDILQGEKLFLNCEVTNFFDDELEFSPRITTFWRSTSGSEVNTGGETEVNNEKIAPGEKKNISVVLPKPLKPQAYEAQLELVNDKGLTISNKIKAHYVLRGVSATIQNLSLDKDYYNAGEMAKVSFNWSDSADNFLGSRIGKSDQSKYFVELEIVDINGKNCSDKVREELDINNLNPKFDVLISSDCQNSKVSASIMDGDNNILDKNDVEVGVKKMSNVDFKDVSLFKKMAIYVVIGLFIISLVLIVLKKKTEFLNVVVIMFLFCGLFFANDTEAASFSGTYGIKEIGYLAFAYHNIGITANLNKSTYSPGETVTASVSGFSYNCINSLIDYYLGIKVNNSSFARHGWSFAKVYPFSHTFTAPSTPGTYYATFWYRDNRCSENGGVVLVNGAYVPRCTPTNGELVFTLRYTVAASAPPSYSCTGSIPAGYAMCSGDNTSLSYNLSWLNVGTSSNCTTARKCEYYSTAPVYANPTVSAWATPSNINLGGIPALIRQSSIISWTINNYSTACGGGCTCSLTGDLSESNISYSGTTATRSLPIASAGDRAVTVTCKNSTGGTGSSSVNINVYCNTGSMGKSDCSKQCGEGTEVEYTRNADCSVTSSAPRTCNLGDCPIQVEYQEVAP